MNGIQMIVSAGGKLVKSSIRRQVYPDTGICIEHPFDMQFYKKEAPRQT
jgi:hypothetical protein